MLIEDRAQVDFSVTDLGTAFEINFTDPNTSDDLGTLTIAKNKGMAFLESLLGVYREIRGPYSEFDPNLKANTNLQNLESRQFGTIKFSE